jgi:integrative and conjugative element protein (TIGR02256 family)
MMMIFKSQDLGYSVALEEDVVKHLEKFRQAKITDTEAGGQLFAIFENGKVVIREITGPRPTDKRTRNSYIPDRKAEQREIDYWFKHGLHYVGDWHTHPSSVPEPSSTDKQNINSAFRSSNHELSGFVMVVIGNASFPIGIWLAIYSGLSEIVLQPTNP